MDALYNLVAGPLAWLAGLIFVGGIGYKLFDAYKSAQDKDPMVLDYFDFKYGMRSILRWSTPYATTNMKLQPVMTAVTFIFHICAVLVPVFLSAHVILWAENFGIHLWELPDGLADLMTVLAMAGCGYFLYRRLSLPEVKYLTTTSDFVVLAIVFAPFLTGFLAYHQIMPYKFMLTLHILSGEIMLAAIPFTRLSHMIFAPLTRAYAGSEFGAVRHAKDW